MASEGGTGTSWSVSKMRYSRNDLSIEYDRVVKDQKTKTFTKRVTNKVVLERTSHSCRLSLGVTRRHPPWVRGINCDLLSLLGPPLVHWGSAGSFRQCLGSNLNPGLTSPVGVVVGRSKRSGWTELPYGPARDLLGKRLWDVVPVCRTPVVRSGRDGEVPSVRPTVVVTLYFSP